VEYLLSAAFVFCIAGRMKLLIALDRVLIKDPPR